MQVLDDFDADDDGQVTLREFIRYHIDDRVARGQDVESMFRS